MYDSAVPLSRVLAYTLWALVGLFSVIAFGLTLAGHWGSAFMLSQVACILAVAAAVSHIRCYALGICALVKATHTLPHAPGAGREREPLTSHHS